MVTPGNKREDVAIEGWGSDKRPAISCRRFAYRLARSSSGYGEEWGSTGSRHEWPTIYLSQWMDIAHILSKVVLPNPLGPM
jgi:hypothetical protein